MKYTITQNLKNLEGDDLKECLSNFEELLSEHTPIRFALNIKIESFIDLINIFFYQKKITYGLSNKQQCSGERRRSLIDFYLLQQYYLEESLTIEECYDIYINLDRGETELARRIKEHPSWYEPNLHTEEERDKYILNNYIKYYCTSVKRNVFHFYSVPTLTQLKESLKDHDYKIKDLKVVKEEAKKQVKLDTVVC